MDEIEVGRIVLLWLWCFGLACIEIEIEGGYGWAQRLPTWWLGTGLVGKVYGFVMGHRPLTGYHVFAFTIPIVILHLPYAMGVDWTLGGELRTIGTFFALAVFWDYMWFVFNPAYTVARFKKGNVWWFEVPWIWRFPLDYYTGLGLSIVLAGLAGVADGEAETLYRHLWMLAGLGGADRRRRDRGAALPALVPPHAPRGRRRPAQRAHVPAARARCGLVRRRSGPTAARASRWMSASSAASSRSGSPRRTTCSSRSTPVRLPSGP